MWEPSDGASRWSHASFFSGVGGTDLGLERAGWRTVSFSEIDPYASAVLGHVWPGVPNLGDITSLADGRWGGQPAERADLLGGSGVANASGSEHRSGPHSSSIDPNLGSIVDVRDRECGPLRSSGGDWQQAFLWTGGFPCQDLSVAGKRRGLRDAAGNATRSGLAFAFLDLVGRYRPPAFILENVPGLLTSHRGKDLGVLLGAMGELGYWWAYRVLDGRHFGVPQRRRRVFIVALHARICAGTDGPAEVLSVGHRCERHPPAGGGAGARAARVAVVGSDDPRPSLSLTRTMHKRHDEDTDTLVLGGAPPDPDRVRKVDGLARRSYDRPGLEDAGIAATLNSGGNSGGFRTEPGEHLIAVTSGDARGRDDLLPVGLDSNRYRCCGNGVIAPVAEYLGLRLRAWVEVNVPQ